MNVAVKTQTTYLGVRLTEDMRTRIAREAMRRTEKTGRRVTSTDVIRFLVNAYLPPTSNGSRKRKDGGKRTRGEA